jgi:hypothetical protein
MDSRLRGNDALGRDGWPDTCLVILAQAGIHPLPCSFFVCARDHTAYGFCAEAAGS